MAFSRYLLALVLTCGVAAELAAAEKKTNRDPRPVYAALDAMGQAYNRHDAPAVAGLWAKDGVYTDRDSGEKVSGRDRLEAVYRGIFARFPQTELSLVVHSVRFITADVAQVEATVTVRHGMQEEVAADFTAILKKAEGKWLLDSAQEAELPRTPTPAEHLQPLAWLIGSWVDDAEDIDVSSSFRWSAKKAFLIRSYRVEKGSEVQHEGTQVFGWDPEKKQIRTWIFGSDGAFGEGTCEAGDGRLVARLSGLLPDGRKGSMTQVFARQGPDAITSQLVGVQLDGQLQPAGPPVRMVRVAEQQPDPAAK